MHLCTFISCTGGGGAIFTSVYVYVVPCVFILSSLVSVCEGV